MIDQELLIEAWPEKYLAMPGLTTVDGWMCTGRIETGKEQGGPGTLWQTPVRLDTKGNIIWVPQNSERGFDTLFVPDSLMVTREAEWRQGLFRWRKARDNNELLPLVDPRDPAGWACLLRDLAEACDHEVGATQHTLHKGKNYMGRLAWALSSSHLTNGRSQLMVFPGIPVNTDPAEVLAMARIQMREKNKADR